MSHASHDTGHAMSTALLNQDLYANFVLHLYDTIRAINQWKMIHFLHRDFTVLRGELASYTAKFLFFAETWNSCDEQALAPLCAMAIYIANLYDQDKVKCLGVMHYVRRIGLERTCMKSFFAGEVGERMFANYLKILEREPAALLSSIDALENKLAEEGLQKTSAKQYEWTDYSDRYANLVHRTVLFKLYTVRLRQWRTRPEWQHAVETGRELLHYINDTLAAGGSVDSSSARVEKFRVALKPIGEGCFRLVKAFEQVLESMQKCVPHERHWEGDAWPSAARSVEADARSEATKFHLVLPLAARRPSHDRGLRTLPPEVLVNIARRVESPHAWALRRWRYPPEENLLLGSTSHASVQTPPSLA
jgi:hypothetical protein